MGNPQPSPSVPGLFRAAGVNVLPTLACSVINLLLCDVGYSVSLLAGYVGKVHRLDGAGRSNQVAFEWTRCLAVAQGIVSPARKGAHGCVILG